MKVTIEDIANAVRDLKEAEKTECSCSGFVLQYDGCLCARGQLVKLAQRKLRFLEASLIEEGEQHGKEQNSC